jgi:hypothetical protein
MKRPPLRTVLGKDNHGHKMTLRRKSGSGVGNFKDVTKPMTADRLRYIRERARRTVSESIQRQWILLLSASGISKRVVG